MTSTDLNTIADEQRIDTASRTVAALIPGASVQDDGGGAYIALPGEPDENYETPMAFVIHPDEASTPERAHRWQYQFGGTRVVESDLTIDATPAEVAAWVQTIAAS